MLSLTAGGNATLIGAVLEWAMPREPRMCLPVGIWVSHSRFALWFDEFAQNVVKPDRLKEFSRYGEKDPEVLFVSSANDDVDSVFLVICNV